MSDLREAMVRTHSRMEAAANNPMFAFAGFDIQLAELEDAIDRLTAATVHKMHHEGGVALALRDLAGGALLVGLSVGQIREERAAHERQAA